MNISSLWIVITKDETENLTVIVIALCWGPDKNFRLTHTINRLSLDYKDKEAI